MIDSLLLADIKSFLIAHAYGSIKATPRQRLLRHLHAQGHTVCDRGLRKIYGRGGALEGLVGSSGSGIFWIVTADDRRAATKQLHAASMSSLVREKRIKDGAPQGQIPLFEEGR